MPSNAPAQPAAPAADSVSDPSRRTFLAGLSALLATAAFSARDAVAQWSGDSAPFHESVDYPPPRRYDYPSDYGRRRDYSYPGGYNRAPGYQPGWQNRNPWSARPLDNAPATSRMLDLNPVIQRYITRQRESGRLAANERSAWLVQDFTTNRYLATLNADIAYQSASMIKPFIALAFFYKVQEGQLAYSPDRRRRMEAMIQYSNNHATNYFIELLNQTSESRNGPAEVEHTLKLRHPGLFRHTQVLENIPRGGRSYRNRASALDYSRFLQALWYNQLPYSMEIKRLMSLPNRDRIYTGASNVSKGTWVFDKTGTTARLCGDMGILVAKGRDGRRYPYTFIGIIEKSTSASNYGSWKNSRGNVIREVSSLVYTHMQQMHNLV